MSVILQEVLLIRMVRGESYLILILFIKQKTFLKRDTLVLGMYYYYSYDVYLLYVVIAGDSGVNPQ